MTRTLQRSRVGRAGQMATVLTGLGLFSNVVSGIVTSHALHAAGRGDLAAITTAPGLISILLVGGSSQAIAYHQARRPGNSAQLLGTAALLLLPLALLSAIVGEAVIHFTLASQPAHTRFAASLFMLTTFLYICNEAGIALFAGARRYRFVFGMRAAVPAGSVVVYGILWWMHRLTVDAAVITAAALLLAATCVSCAAAVRRFGWGAPDGPLARSIASYAVRSHAPIAAKVGNMRLDLLLLPAFVEPAALGFYVVATSASALVVDVTSGLAGIAFAEGASRPAGRDRVVFGVTYLCLAVGAVIALGLAVFATPLVHLLYGAGFSDAVEPLRILLPGAILYAGSWALYSGLMAAGKPLTATCAEGAGFVVTVVGLALVLPRHGGIAPVAWVSTISYSVVFLGCLVLYCRAQGVAVASFLRAGAVLRAR